MLRKIRIVLAAVMLIGITWLFVDFTGTARHLFSWMAKLQALEAILALNVAVMVGLAVLTLVFGRIYCSVICPLGIMQDVFGWLGKKVKKNRYTYSKEVKWLRYPLLIVFIIALLAGIGTLFQLLAPYSAFGRIATNLLQPVWQAGNNVLASIAEYYDSYAFYHTNIWLRALPSLVISIVTLVILAVLAWRNGRTYCNTICPVGTFLSFFSRFSFLKIHFDVEKCKNCSLSRGSRNSRNTGDSSSEVEGRRTFLLSSALLTTAAIAQKKDKLMDGGLAEIQDKVAPKRQTPIAPPGSGSRANLEQHCTGCQLCISECPNEVLRPSDDLWHLMMPVMSYERGYCRPECNRCSQICPAGAIKPITVEDKASTQIGHAVFIKKNCVVLRDEVECGNCASHCPTGAIEMVPSDPNDEESPYIPAVNEARCIGCGACENLCPARPHSAIYVEGHEQHKEI